MKIVRSISILGSKRGEKLRQSMHDASWMEAPLCLDHDRAAACGADYLLLSPTTSSSSPALWCERNPKWVGSPRLLLWLVLGDIARPQCAVDAHSAVTDPDAGIHDQPAAQAVLAGAGTQKRVA